MPFFLATSVLFLITIAGIGITISTFCRTQQQAILTSFMFLQPAVLLSGYAFPIENMPKVIQFVTNFIPLRYFMSIIRGIFLKGVGLRELWPNALALLVFGLVIFIISGNRFQKKLG